MAAGCRCRNHTDREMSKKRMDYKKEIIKSIYAISGSYSPYEVYADWIRCCALAVSNSCQLLHNKTWQVREEMYKDTMKKYDKADQKKFVEMFSMLALALEDEITDILGQIYMESGMGSAAAGQFFTPYHLSELCAAMLLGEPDENGIYYINEPSCGGGGMIIAAAAVLKKRQIDYQRCMKVVAQDLDWKGVYMTYLQLSLLGIKAVCVQGNTLSEPFTDAKYYPADRVLYTPARAGVLI